MSTSAKKAWFITVLIVGPMLATDLLLRNIHTQQFVIDWRSLAIIGVALAMVISLLWPRTNKNNTQPKVK